MTFLQPQEDKARRLLAASPAEGSRLDPSTLAPRSRLPASRTVRNRHLLSQPLRLQGLSQPLSSLPWDALARYCSPWSWSCNRTPLAAHPRPRPPRYSPHPDPRVPETLSMIQVLLTAVICSDQRIKQDTRGGQWQPALWDKRYTFCLSLLTWIPTAPLPRHFHSLIPPSPVLSFFFLIKVIIT